MSDDHLSESWPADRFHGPGADPFGGGDLVSALARWAAELRVDEATSARRRERWLTQVAAEASTFASVLADLSDRERPVVLQLSTGRRHLGHLMVLGQDFVGLRLSTGAEVLIRLGAITAVRTQAHEHPALSGRPLHLDLLFADAVVALAEDRPTIHMTVEPTEAVHGQLVSVGVDVATVRLSGDSRATVYLPLAAVVEIGMAQR